MSGRIAVITGGTRGLGRAISLRLAEEGHIPAMIYRRDAASAEDALFEIRAREPRARTYRVDVSNEAEVEEVVSRIRTDLGPIGCLVNNAFRSGRAPKKTHEVEVAAWREDLEVNLTGQFIVTRAALASMLEAQFGRIVFIGSLAMHGESGRVAYSVAKTALIGLTNTITREYAKSGITANVVSPGFIDTGAFARLSEEIQRRALARVPSHRAGTKEEVAALVAHLASDQAAYITGQVIGVDGGAR